MGWRQETQLKDMEPDTEFEIECRVCGKHRYEIAIVLAGPDRLGHLFIDEMAKRLKCHDRKCGGPVKLCVMHDKLEEGFVGGMP